MVALTPERRRASRWALDTRRCPSLALQLLVVGKGGRRGGARRTRQLPRLRERNGISCRQNAYAASARAPGGNAVAKRLTRRSVKLLAACVIGAVAALAPAAGASAASLRLHLVPRPAQSRRCRAACRRAALRTIRARISTPRHVTELDERWGALGIGTLRTVRDARSADRGAPRSRRSERRPIA